MNVNKFKIGDKVLLFGAYLRDVAANRGRGEETYKKKCPECDQYSYSASKEGIWRCSVGGFQWRIFVSRYICN